MGVIAPRRPPRPPAPPIGAWVAGVLALGAVAGVLVATLGAPFEHAPGGSRASEALRSRPDLHPPAIQVVRSSPAASRGYVFLTPKRGPAQAGPMILDAAGRLVWFRPLPPHVLAYDLSVQRFEGRPALVWWQGHVAHGRGAGEAVIADESYRTIARVHAAHGLKADLHELQLTPRGTALIQAFRRVPRDLSPFGGPARGSVLDSVVQEIDVRSGRLVFEWHSIDHVGLAESYKELPNRRSLPWDYFHLNSIQDDGRGGLLLSARHTNALYDVDRATGAVRWRLGGRRSDFAMGPGSRFVAQHDARPQPGDRISLFDNGAPPDTGRESRGLVLRLDRLHHRVRLAREYRHDPEIESNSQGSTQLLAGGHAFVGWGGRSPWFTEYAPDGRVLFDARFAGVNASYRAYRYPWVGRPTERPAVVVSGPSGRRTLYASWNGATQVARWDVMAGTGPQDLRRVASAPRRGFETAIRLPSDGPYLVAVPRDASGRALGASRSLRVR